MVEVLIAPCSAEASKYAVMHWHYSRRMPVCKVVKFGVWEDERFTGAVLFGLGASDALGARFGLTTFQVCELTRVALTDHATPVTRVVAESLRLLRNSNPGLRLVVSFADPRQGHLGVIYQAGNWVYAGRTNPDCEYLIDGRWMHSRAVPHKKQMGRPATRDPKELSTLPRRSLPGKHRYLMPLDKAMRRRIAPYALPYPHADEGSTVSRPVSDGEGQVQALASAP